MVEYVEELPAKLNRFRFRNAEVLEHRKIPIRISGADADIATSVAKLLDWRIGIGDHLRERCGIEPCADGFWSGIRALPRDQVRAIGGEARDFRCATLVGNVGGVEDGEWR